MSQGITLPTMAIDRESPVGKRRHFPPLVPYNAPLVLAFPPNVPKSPDDKPNTSICRRPLQTLEQRTMSRPFASGAVLQEGPAEAGPSEAV